MYSGNYGDVEFGTEDADEIDSTLLATEPDGIYLVDDDDTHNHDVGPAPRPPRHSDL